MKKYIQKIEKLVKQKMSSEDKPKEDEEQKGFMARRGDRKEQDSPLENNMDAVEIVANAIVHIRKKRMELK